MVKHQNSWERIVIPLKNGIPCTLIHGLLISRPRATRRELAPSEGNSCAETTAFSKISPILALHQRHSWRQATPFVVSRNVVLCPDQAPNSSCRVHVLGDPEYQSNNHIRLSSKIKFCNFVCNFLMILLTNHSKEEVHLSYLILARSVGHKPESHSNCEFVQRCNPARQ